MTDNKTLLRGRRSGNYVKAYHDLIVRLCTAKKGNKIILVHPLGNFVLIYDGRWKPHNYMKIKIEDSQC